MAHSQDNLSFVLVYIVIQYSRSLVSEKKKKKEKAEKIRDKSLPRILAKKNENDRIWMVVIESY